jgi:hypothetical protein
MTCPYSAHIVVHHTQREVQERMRSDSAEMRELLLKILTNQGELRQVYDMQNAGEHVAEPLMEAGQMVRITFPFQRASIFTTGITGDAAST